MFSLLFVILFIFANVNNSTSDYQPDVGNIFHFDILKADAYVKVGDSEYSGSGYSILGNILQVPYTCTLIVDDVSITLIRSTFSGGGYSTQIYSYWVDNDEFHLRIATIYPLSYCLPFLANPSAATDGFETFFIPFVDQALISDYFDEYVAQSNTDLTDYLLLITDPSFEAIKTEVDNILYFEVYFTGLTEVFNPVPFEITFKHQFRCAYESDTGFLLGMHYKTEGKGTYNGEKIKYEFESLIEKQGYNLPEAQLTGFDITEDWWIIAAAGGGGLLLIIIVIILVVSGTMKKKPKKKKKKSSKKKR